MGSFGGGGPVIRVGTSGWSYDDWVGPVYPKHLRGRRDRWLAFYARTFETVEVNSTFYRLPVDSVVDRWVDRSPDDDFELSLKVPRRVTHDAMVDGDHEAALEGIDALVDRIEPLGEAGRLGAILVQLSPHFHGGPGEVDLLATVLARLQGAVDVAVEFRHRSWTDGDDLKQAAREVLSAHDAAVCTVDGPSFPTVGPQGSDHAYVRLHGRRADAWFEATGLDDHARYDYAYTADELAPWVDRLQGWDQARVRVYFNNHPDGQAFRNADMLREMLGLPRPERSSGGQQRLDAF